MPYEGAGKYRHYKGGNYEVLGLAFAEADKDRGFEPTMPGCQVVVYRPLTSGSLLDDTNVTFWLRDLDNFNEEVYYDGPGDTIPRFQLIMQPADPLAVIPIGRVLQAEVGRLPNAILERLKKDTDLDPRTRASLVDLVTLVRGVKDALLAHMGEMDVGPTSSVGSDDAPTLKG